jgi:hypothetical protein
MACFRFHGHPVWVLHEAGDGQTKAGDWGESVPSPISRSETTGLDVCCSAHVQILECPPRVLVVSKRVSHQLEGYDEHEPLSPLSRSMRRT